MIDNLSKSELFTRASLLIKYGFRTTIIALDTGLPIHIIRASQEVTGKSPCLVNCQNLMPLLKAEEP